jgi:polysaccharide pyruvyl transferase WcaK-like protein
MAQKLGKKTILYANGIGPIYSKSNEKKAADILKNITLATTRDEESYNDLIKMGIDKDKIYHTADEAVTVIQNKNLNAYKNDFKNYINGDYIVISVRKWKYLKSDFFGAFSAAIDIICRENNLIPVYIVMEPKNDRNISEHLSTLNGRAYLADVGGDIEKTLSVVRSAEAIISMRLHTLIFAAVFGIPMIGVSYDPKVRGFMNDVFDDDIYTVELKDFTKNILTEKFNMLMSDKENAKIKINESAKKLCEKAGENADLFIKAMYGEED